jgi:ribosomal protein S7
MVQNVKYQIKKKINKNVNKLIKIAVKFNFSLIKKFTKSQFKNLSKYQKFQIQKNYRYFKNYHKFKKDKFKFTFKSKYKSRPLFKFSIPKDKFKCNFLATSQRLKLYTSSLNMRFRKEEDRFNNIFNIQKLKYYFSLLNLDFKRSKNFNLLKKNYKYLKFKFYNKLKWNKKIILTGIFLSTLNYLTYIYLKTYSNFLFFNKLTNLVMKCGMKNKAENLILKFLETLKTKYQIINPFERFKKVLYLNLIPPVMPKLVGYKNKKTIGIKVNVAFRFNKALRLFIKGAQNLNVSMYTGLVVEFMKLLRGSSYLQEYNQQTWKTINDYTLYFPKYKRRIFYFGWKRYSRFNFTQYKNKISQYRLLKQKANTGALKFKNFWNPIYKDKFKILNLKY